jgi:hypothetical protein
MMSLKNEGPICSADGCSRREPCGFACRDEGNFDVPAWKQRVNQLVEEGTANIKEAYSKSQVPVAWKVRHPKNPRCFYIGDLPEERRSDTGEPDEYFGGEATPLYPPAPRVPLTDEQIDAAIQTEPSAVYRLMGADEFPKLTAADFRQQLRNIARAIERAHGIATLAVTPMN